MSPNIRSSLYMTLSMLGFTVNDLIIKSIGSALPSSQAMCLRGLLLLLLIILIAHLQGTLRRWTEALTVQVLIRSVCEGTATVFFLSALMQLPFASISAILQSLPLAVTLGAALLFAEPVGWRRWLAIFVGFIGVLIIIRPGMESFDKASILVCISVLFAAARDLITGRLPMQLPSILVSGSTALVTVLLGMGITIANGSWQPVSTVHWLSLAAAAGFLFFGYQFIIMSMRTGEIAYVVPYRYSSLLWAILFAYWFFDEVPDSMTLLGSAIVVSMGLFSLYREMVLVNRIRQGRGS